MIVARGLHRAAPLANGLLLLCVVGAVLASPSVLVSLIALVAVAVLAIVSGERPTSLVPWRRFVLFFAVILFVAQALSVHSGAIVLTSPFRLTTGGLLAGARMALRFLIILGASALFVRTTDSDRLAGALVRLRVPYRYAYLVILSLRFVPFFQDELRAVRDAQKVRGIRLSVRSPRRVLRAVRYTFVPVLVSGLHRVDAIAISMRGRCFGLSATRTTSRLEKGSGWSLVAFLLGLLFVGIAIVARLERWVG
jgi:energy-coupling factor transport system permease protein